MAKGKKTGGRKKGTPNKATPEVRAFFRELIADPIYQRSFRKAWRARALGDRMEALGYYYAYGKPPQAIELSGTFDHVHYLASKTPE